jgi:DNA mismatch endonuclease (patch repair protein)
MSRIRSANTGPELIVRKLLHRLGFRFRLHRKDLPGKPDIVLPGQKTVIFVHGCYWHRHSGCSSGSSMPTTNTSFWKKKFRENVERDQRVGQELEELGWKVIVVWECETRKQKTLELAERLNNILRAPIDSRVSGHRKRRRK